MTIILYHTHYSEEHLEEVKSQMRTLGTPTIRAIWSESYGAWMAIEGCHRIRAAKELELIPQIIDISNDETVIIQSEDEEIEVNVTDLTIELAEDAWKSEIINFEED